MSGAHEELERAEHASRGGVHHAVNKHIGLTMAIIGALIALCAAMVGSERNELMRTMVEQTQANADSAGASTKHRLVMMELEKQRAQRAELPATVDQPECSSRSGHAPVSRARRGLQEGAHRIEEMDG